MAKRRMFNPVIVGSDAFVDMPMSSQALYFHLCMYADDDGFVGRPKQICRMVGANEDDLKILFAKRYLLAFESGVAVVKHWLVHNSIRADLYAETTYREEKKTLGLNEFGAYTELRDGVIPVPEIKKPAWLKKRQSDHNPKELEPTTARPRHVDGTSTARERHLDKVRLGKVSVEKKDTNVSTKKPDGFDDAAIATPPAGSGTVKLPNYSEAQKNAIKRVYAEYCKCFAKNMNTYKLTDKRKAKIAARLREFSVEDLLLAIRNISADDFYTGGGDRKWFAHLDWIFNSYERTEEWVNGRQAASKPKSKIELAQERHAARRRELGLDDDK